MAEVLDEPKQTTKKLTLTADDLAKLIDEKVQEALAKMSDGKDMAKQIGSQSAMPMYPYEPKDGDIVPPGFAPPPGWQLIKTTDGNLILHPKAPRDFNRRERRDVLKAVDAKWEEMNRAVAGQAAPQVPKKLLVNQRFAELFENLIRWGDNCQVMAATEDAVADGVSIATSKAKFKFVL